MCTRGRAQRCRQLRLHLAQRRNESQRSSKEARKKLRSEETKLTESEKDRQSAAQLTEPLLELRAEATVDWAWLRSGVLATAGRLAVNAKAFLTYVLLYT